MSDPNTQIIQYGDYCGQRTMNAYWQWNDYFFYCDYCQKSFFSDIFGNNSRGHFEIVENNEKKCLKRKEKK